MYNGYANEDSYLFDVVWANDRPLYEAIVAEGKKLLNWLPSMTDQTLGLNVLHAVKAAVNRGGWGYDRCPDTFRDVPKASYMYLSVGNPERKQCDLNNVNEAEFGANVRDAVGNEK